MSGSNPLAGISSNGAASSGPGAAVYHFFAPQIVDIFLLVLIVLVVWNFLRHNHSKMFGLIGVGVIAMVVIVDPQSLGHIVTWMTGLFNQL